MTGQGWDTVLQRAPAQRTLQGQLSKECICGALTSLSREGGGARAPGLYGSTSFDSLLFCLQVIVHDGQLNENAALLSSIVNGNPPGCSSDINPNSDDKLCLFSYKVPCSSCG